MEHRPLVLIDGQVSQLPQGDTVAGAGGATPEEEMAYAERTDIVGDELIYKGQASPGTADGAAFWRIRRLTLGLDGDVLTHWADGNANFDNVWDDRATLTYS